MKNGFATHNIKRIRSIPSYLYNYLYSYKPISTNYKKLSLHERLESFGIYLIATQKGLYALDRGTLYKILSGRFYGITVQQNQVYIFERIGAIKGRILKAYLDGNNKLVDIKVLIDGLSPGCHQIDIIDEFLYICDTYNNRILYYDLKNFTYNFVYPLDKLENGRHSHNYGHMNSIYKIRNLYYIMCHNETSKTGRNSEILILDNDLKVIRKIDTKASHAHNIIVYDGKYIYCDSMNNTLKVNKKDVFVSNHFTRGLSISKKGLILGGSDHAKRKDRTKVGGHIYILNHKFELYESFFIPGMVQEIRKIDSPDYSLSNYAHYISNNDQF